MGIASGVFARSAMVWLVAAGLTVVPPAAEAGLADDAPAADGDLPFSVMLRTNQGWGLSHDGYTTLGGLVGFPLGSGSTYENGLPFLDLRGHVENDGGFALTSDLGYRWADWDDFRIYGIHAGFDWRQNRGHIDTSWINLGVETLGYDWDVRLDGYIPVGDSTDVECVCVDEYEGNEAILDYRTFVGMGGIEGEFAINNNRGNWGIVNEMPTTAALRLHWFDGKEGESATGGQVRLELEPWRSVFVQGEGGYDTHFGAIATIRIGLRFSDSAASDDRPYKLQERFVEPIERQELVIGDVQHINRTFIDPATDMPVPLYHVDNTFDAGGVGTFEDRFQSLAEAEAATPEGAVMILYEGDGTTSFYNTGFQMKDDQMLIGEGYAGTLDIFEAQICFLGGGRPTITNPAGDALTLADNNLVAGIDIDDPSANAIFGTGITDGYFEDINIFEPFLSGIRIENAVGSFAFVDNDIFGSGFGSTITGLGQEANRDAIEIATGLTGDVDVVVTGNHIEGGRGDGFEMMSNTTGDVTHLIAENTIIDQGGAGVEFFHLVPSTGSLEAMIVDNVIEGSGEEGINISGASGSGPMNFIITGNEILDSGVRLAGLAFPPQFTPGFSGIFLGFNGSTGTALIEDNLIAGGASGGIIAQLSTFSANARLDIEILNNTIIDNGQLMLDPYARGIAFANSASGAFNSVVNSNISGNLIDNNGFGGVGLFTRTQASATQCTNLDDNTGGDGYLLDNVNPQPFFGLPPTPTGGAITFEPMTGNSGALTNNGAVAGPAGICGF